MSCGGPNCGRVGAAKEGRNFDGGRVRCSEFHAPGGVARQDLRQLVLLLQKSWQAQRRSAVRGEGFAPRAAVRQGRRGPVEDAAELRRAAQRHGPAPRGRAAERDGRRGASRGREKFVHRQRGPDVGQTAQRRRWGRARRRRRYHGVVGGRLPQFVGGARQTFAVERFKRVSASRRQHRQAKVGRVAPVDAQDDAKPGGLHRERCQRGQSPHAGTFCIAAEPGECRHALWGQQRHHGDTYRDDEVALGAWIVAAWRQLSTFAVAAV
mmetsp:Transcript_102309/g.328072  ORF Transcript_102309/g.328072 Transcript_102309/m.328072 type:complete len:266 (-) Transcript_102309:6352-7149(-)